MITDSGIRNRVVGLGLVFGVVLTLLLLAGCGGSDSNVVAVVDDYEITSDELNDYFGGIRATYASAQDEFEKRRELLDTLIVNRLLIQEAYDRGIDKMEEISRLVMANREKFLLDALYEEKVTSKADPTETEMRDFWNMLEYRVRASHILVHNEDTAKALAARITGGENFEALAYNYSVDPSAKQNKGDLGYFAWGDMVDEFQDVAFKLQPGEIAPPVKTRFGYHIIKVVDRVASEKRLPYETMKESIRDKLFDAKVRRLTEEYFYSLQEKYPVTIDTITCKYLLHKRESMYPPQVLANLPTNDFDKEALDRNERELVMATWDGGQMTVFQYLTRVADVPLRLRPNFTDYDSLGSIVFRLKTLDILAMEALRLGLDNSDIYLRKVRLFKELNMADIIKNDSLPGGEMPTEEEIRVYYEEHIDEYTEKMQIHVYEILLSDELTARQLAKSIKSIDDFRRQAANLTERPGKRAANGDLGYIGREYYPEIFDLARKTSVGSIGGPVVTGGRYSIFYVMDKIDPRIKDFLTVKSDVERRMIRERRDASFQRWIDERMKATEIEVYDDALWATIDKTKYGAADSLSN